MIVIPPNDKRDAYPQPNWISLDIETIPAPLDQIEKLSERQLRKMASSTGVDLSDDRDLVEIAHANSALNPAMAGIAVIVMELSERLWWNLRVPHLMKDTILHEYDNRYIALMDPDLDISDSQLRACEFNIVGGLGRAAQVGLDFLNKLLHPSADATLMTYNGRRFDLPLMAFHYARHHVLPSRSLSFNRYDLSSNLDLCEVLSFQGAGRLIAMEEVSLGLGLASPKEDLDGTKVGQAWNDRRYLDVARYCVGDVRQLSQLAQLTLPYWRL